MVILGGNFKTVTTASCTLVEDSGRTLDGLYEQSPPQKVEVPSDLGEDNEKDP